MNLSPTKRRGLEFEGKFSINSAVDFGAKYARTYAHFKEGIYEGFETNDNSFTPFNANLAGKDVPLVPKDRLSLNLGWQLDAATRLSLFGHYVGSQRYDNDQTNLFQKMPSYKTTDVKVTHLLGAWKLSVGVNNIFDKSYYSYGVTNVSGVRPVRYNVYPEDRRNTYLSAEYRFN
jgi:iron complex outermembrane receptor protein